MIRGFRRFLSVCAVVCAFAATAAVAGDKSTGSNASNFRASNPQVATGLIEVRIRRLHLMRPDLIPYPIAYEIIC